MSRRGKELRLDRFFGALSDRTRLRLLNLIGRDEVCVCFLVEVTQLPQPTISRHLAYLRRAGLVQTRKEGRWIHYRLTEPADEHAARILAETLLSLTGDEEMKRERALLVRYCCTDSLPANLKEAPRPVAIVGRRR